MSKFEIKVSNSLEKDVLNRASEIVNAGKQEDFANISGLGELHKIYIDINQHNTSWCF